MRKPTNSSSGKNTSGRRSPETRGNDRPKSFGSAGRSSDRSNDRSFKPSGPRADKPSGSRFGKPEARADRSSSPRPSRFGKPSGRDGAPATPSRFGKPLESRDPASRSTPFRPKTSESRSGERPRTARPTSQERPTRPRPEEKTARFPSDNRPSRPYSNDRPSRYNAGERSDRPARSEAPSRPYSNDRPSRYNAGERSDRPARSEAPSRPYSNDRPSRYNAGERSDRPARSEAPARQFSDDRPSRYNTNERSERPARSEAPARQFSDDRPSRYNAGERSERPARSEAPARQFSDDRPSRDNAGERSERPARSEATPATPGGFGKRAPTIHSQEDITLDHSRRVDTGGKATYEADRMKKNLPPKVQAKFQEEEGDMIRLNKYISNAGLCSRREADELISSGQIRVNGTVIDELGYKVQPNDNVTYGRKVLNKEKLVYLLLNKPKDYLTTTEDPEERKTVMDLVGKACKERIYPVGRLDRNTTGLLLLTNDGELAEKLSHPSNNMKKVYQAELDKPITLEHFEEIKAGLELEDGFIKPDDLGIVTPDAEVVGIEIHSGKNRIVRRIFEHLGYDVLKLDRTIYAGLTKKDLPRGMWRFLTEKEVIRLKYMM